jgi:hypothetical protein
MTRGSPRSAKRGASDTSSKIMAGGLSGAGLIKVAATMPEPWKQALTLAVPALVAVYMAVWPQLMLTLENFWKRHLWKMNRDIKRRDIEDAINAAKSGSENASNAEVVQHYRDSIRELEKELAAVTTATPPDHDLAG